MGLTELVESKGYKMFMTKLYGWGAAVVILGALFKIQHYPGAPIMLVAGLGTEAIIFFMSAFEPLHSELDWTLVYPELAGMGKIEDEIGHAPAHEVHEKKKSALEKFDDMIDKAQITPELFEKLGMGIQKLNTTTEKLHDVSDATTATNNYVENFEKASQSVLEFSNSYAKTANTINQSADNLADTYLKSADVVSDSANEYAKVIAKSGQELLNNASNVHIKSVETLNQATGEFANLIGKTSTDVHTLVTMSGQELANAYEKLTESMNNEIGRSTSGNKSYGEQLESMTKNLTALNAVYELQLQGSSEHLEVSKQLFNGMDEMMMNLTDAIDDSKKYKVEVSKLGQNLTALNTIYGNMLSAMNFKNS